MKKILFLIITLLTFYTGGSFASSIVFQGLFSGISNNQYSIVESTPDGKFIYAINSSSGSIESFSVLTTGELQSSTQNVVVPGLKGAQTLEFNTSSDFILVGTDSTNTQFGLHAYFRGQSGGFEPAKFLSSAGGATTEDGLFDHINVQGVAVSPDGKNIYVTGTCMGAGDCPDANEGVVAVLTSIEFDSANKQVKYTKPTAASDFIVEQDPIIDALDSPVAIEATLENVFVLSDTNDATKSDAIVYFDRNKNSGLLSNPANISANSGLSDLAEPRDLVVSSSNGQIFVAASGSGAILQFTKGSGVPLALKKTFKTLPSNVQEPSGVAKVDGLSGVSALAALPGSSSLYALSPTLNRIVPFYLDEDNLVPVQNNIIIAPSADSTIKGLNGVKFLAAVNGGQNFYASGSSAVTGFAKFSRQSKLDLLVESQNRTKVQPGQIASFGVTLTNMGPADAPAVELTMSPSNSVVSITGTGASSCETSTKSGRPQISCNIPLLANTDKFTVNVAIRPTTVESTSLLVAARSINVVSRESSSVSGSAKIAVGSFKSGALSFSGVIVCLLGLTFIRVLSNKELFAP